MGRRRPAAHFEAVAREANLGHLQQRSAPARHTVANALPPRRTCRLVYEGGFDPKRTSVASSVTGAKGRERKPRRTAQIAVAVPLREAAGF